MKINMPWIFTLILLISAGALFIIFPRPDECPGLFEPRPVFISSEETLQLSEELRIIDARGRLWWLRERLPHSIYIQWDHLSELGARSRGLPKKDRYSLMAELARAGLSIQDAVLVVGRGIQGRGEEARLAWHLRQLGFVNVRLMNFDRARKLLEEQGGEIEAGPTRFPKAKLCPPRPNLESSISVAELMEIRERILSGQLSPEEAPLMIDVRRTLDIERPEFFAPFETLHLHWRILLDEEGLPLESARIDFENRLIKPERPLILLSFAGLSAAYPTFILREWGFNALLLPGGIESFFGDPEGVWSLREETAELHN